MKLCPFCSVELDGSRTLHQHLMTFHHVGRERSDELVATVELGLDLFSGRQTASVCAPASGASRMASAKSSPPAADPRWPIDVAILLQLAPSIDKRKLTLGTCYALRRASRSLLDSSDGLRSAFVRELATILLRALA